LKKSFKNRFQFLLLGLCGLLLTTASCQRSSNKFTDKTNTPTQSVKMSDIHSYAKPQEAVVKHISLDLDIVFSAKVLNGTATLTIEAQSDAKKLWLDTKDLVITSISSNDGPMKYTLHPADSVLGSALEIDIQPTYKKIIIAYHTQPSAEAVQWLSPQQTAGKTHPFLFTQGEAILTRSWIPCQDSPGVRVTYDAKIRTNSPDIMALMSASNPTEKAADGVYFFEMKQAIPSYLIALAAGNLEFKGVGIRTGVYAEPATLEKAVYEFAQMEQMVSEAEKLYGTYAWERYDLVVLPPSFPFGGMENPRLTFATPTILAGDRSLTNLVAHELAHSWSGNLVTNATWNDFWLNEGFTVYFERRIMEAIQGADYADMLEVLGYQDLNHTLDDFGRTSPMTCLKLNLAASQNPDDAVSDVAYEKGYFLLRFIESRIGREAMDKFLVAYFARKPFSSLNTEEFLTYLDAQIISKSAGKITLEEVQEWIYKPGLPATCIAVKADRFTAVDAVIAEFKTSKTLSKETTTKWSTYEWLHFLRSLDETTGIETLTQLDATFSLSNSKNSELQFAWYEAAIKNNYHAADVPMMQFIVQTGRRKFIAPLYKLLMEKRGLVYAQTIYKEARGNYHFVATNTIDAMLGVK
jgi:aminopeptidase N